MFLDSDISGTETDFFSSRKIGPAVFNGGFSTFLAFILLAFSDSYVFLTFFKVCLHILDNSLNVCIHMTQLYFLLQMFGMVVAFGLFHGLLFLPVILSLIGPSSNTESAQESA